MDNDKHLATKADLDALGANVQAIQGHLDEMSANLPLMKADLRVLNGDVQVLRTSVHAVKEGVHAVEQRLDVRFDDSFETDQQILTVLGNIERKLLTRLDDHHQRLKRVEAELKLRAA